MQINITFAGPCRRDVDPYVVFAYYLFARTRRTWRPFVEPIESFSRRSDTFRANEQKYDLARRRIEPRATNNGPDLEIRPRGVAGGVGESGVGEEGVSKNFRGLRGGMQRNRALMKNSGHRPNE